MEVVEYGLVVDVWLWVMIFRVYPRGAVAIDKCPSVG